MLHQQKQTQLHCCLGLVPGVREQQQAMQRARLLRPAQLLLLLLVLAEGWQHPRVPQQVQQYWRQWQQVLKLLAAPQQM